MLLGAAALFRAPLLLGPIAVLFGLIALIRGQYALGAIGTITGAAAILTSPWLWTGIGIAWLYEESLFQAARSGFVRSSARSPAPCLGPACPV